MENLKIAPYHNCAPIPNTWSHMTGHLTSGGLCNERIWEETGFQAMASPQQSHLTSWRRHDQRMRKFLFRLSSSDFQQLASCLGSEKQKRWEDFVVTLRFSPFLASSMATVLKQKNACLSGFAQGMEKQSWAVTSCVALLGFSDTVVPPTQTEKQSQVRKRRTRKDFHSPSRSKTLRWRTRTSPSTLKLNQEVLTSLMTLSFWGTSTPTLKRLKTKAPTGVKKRKPACL